MSPGNMIILNSVINRMDYLYSTKKMNKKATFKEIADSYMSLVYFKKLINKI